MSNWVQANGARIEEEFFNENVAEAKGYDWVEVHAASLANHVHCMICGLAIGPMELPTTPLYQSKGGHLCGYCHEHFLNDVPR